MRPVSKRAYVLGAVLTAILTACGAGEETPGASIAPTKTAFSGHVRDLNGAALSKAQVTLEWPAGVEGANAVTVFTDEEGRFAFAEAFDVPGGVRPHVTVRALGFDMVRTTPTSADSGDGQAVTLRVLMKRVANEANVAPASAWLANVESDLKAKFILSCIGCHQAPAPEARAYAAMIEDANGGATDEQRAESWKAMVKYMNFLSAEEFGRGEPDAPPQEASRVYSVGSGDEIAEIMARHFTGRMDSIQGYDYGAPLIVTPDTVIKEYEVPRPNAIREAVMIGDPPKLYAADVAANRLIRVDVATGRQEDLEVPSAEIMGPHTLIKGKDDSLWVGAFFNGYAAVLDTEDDSWQVRKLVTEDGVVAGLHDPSFDWNTELTTDPEGRIWFSEIVHNGVGYYLPETGETKIYYTPEVPGRPGAGAQLYGLAMTSDRKHIWYSQLGIGVFGCFNTETLEFETVVALPSVDAGPRRLAIDEDDILYVPLYGAGQLVVYDTRARKQIGLYDLPDRASAPYSVTWDPIRKVVWIPTANADVIYRFDPKTKAFGVLPLPRTGAFLRMLQVDLKSGLLVSSYANIVAESKGPRMAFIIDPGDRPMAAEVADATREIAKVEE